MKEARKAAVPVRHGLGVPRCEVSVGGAQFVFAASWQKRTECPKIQRS